MKLQGGHLEIDFYFVQIFVVIQAFKGKENTHCS